MKKLGIFSCFALTGIFGMLFFGADGSAYIDPSVTTYVIQAVAGILVAAGAVVGIYWRRAKKKLNEKLGVDENKNKEVESDEIDINIEKEQQEIQ